MARWTASAKWAEGPALDGRRDMPLALRLSEGLGRTAATSLACLYWVCLGPRLRRGGVEPDGAAEWIDDHGSTRTEAR